MLDAVNYSYRDCEPKALNISHLQACATIVLVAMVMWWRNSGHCSGVRSINCTIGVSGACLCAREYLHSLLMS